MAEENEDFEIDEKSIKGIIGFLARGQAELRSDIKDLTRSMNDLVKVQTQNISSQQHTNKEVEGLQSDVNDPQTGLRPRVERLERSQSNDKVRWGILAAGIIALISSSVGIYTMVVKPAIDASMSNVTAVESINQLVDTNRLILDQMKGESDEPD